MEHIVLAFSSDTAAVKIKKMLEGSGYECHNTVCHTAAELLRTVSDYDNVLIIMGYKLPDMVAEEVYENLEPGCKLMSIVKAEHVHYIDNEDIFILPLPVNRQRLISSINIFLGYTGEHQNKTKNIRSPEDNKLIERAKLFLMEQYHMTEKQAHRFIQKRSMDVGAKVADTARIILNMDN